MAPKLVIDLETIPASETAHLWTPPPDRENPFAPVHAHKIVVLGWAKIYPDKPLHSYGVLTAPLLNEEQILRQLNKLIASFNQKDSSVLSCDLVTFNGREFDLPVIVHRAFHYGIDLSWYYQPRGTRYRFTTDDHFDIFDFLSDHGALRRGTGQDKFCKLMGLPGKLDTDGGQVSAMWENGEHEKVANYCLQDVLQLAFIYHRVQLIRGMYSLEHYRQQIRMTLQSLEQEENEDIQKIVSNINHELLLLEK